MKSEKTKIIIQNGVFKKIPEKLKAAANHYTIVTDVHLKKPAAELLRRLRESDLRCHLFILPSGENTKSLSWIEKLANALLKVSMARDSALIAFGGGVIGDVTGFLASIYMRGIPWVNIPTTLLAMCDSCVGGKTGVDLRDGKNILGSFYPPATVIIDPLLLRTLPEREFRNGLAEITKHGVIADRALFTMLEKKHAAILKRNMGLMKKIISRSIAIKTNIVKCDEKEIITRTPLRSVRMLLNYGHTVGHALERLSNYEIPHGEAVAIGMIAENRVAVGKGLLKEKDSLRIEALLKKFHLPTKIPHGFSGEDIKKAMSSDKKHIGGHLYFSLPVRIGKAKIYNIA